MSLPAAAFPHFTGIIWDYIVLAIVLGLRLSFTLPASCCYPAVWDHAAARRTLDFGGFLARFADIGGGGSNSNGNSAASSTDVLAASKVVVEVVRRKYEKRLAALEAAQQSHHHPLVPGAVFPQGEGDGLEKSVLGRCPMLDGSLDAYLQEWDGTLLDAGYFAAPPAVGLENAAGGEDPGLMRPGTSYDDLWAAMTMGWTQDQSFPGGFDGGL